jgi:hypothetical protein
MTFDERHNEVLKLHTGFFNALAIAAAGGAGFAAISDGNGIGAALFLVLSWALHVSAAALISAMRITRMIQFELWMFPIMVGVMVFVANRIVMWRLNASEKRWLREHGDKGHQTPAE